MTDYQRGWSDCKNTIIELLHSFGPDLTPNFDFVPYADLERICFAIAAQEPEERPR